MIFRLESERTLLNKGFLDSLFPNIVGSKIEKVDNNYYVTINSLRDLKKLAEQVENLPLDISFYNKQILIMDKCLL